MPNGGVGNINHRPDRLRSDRVSNGASLSGLGIAESRVAWPLWQPSARPELRQAIRAAVRGGNVGHSPSGASVDADGSSVWAVVMLLRLPGTPPAHTGAQERQPEAGLPALSALRNVTGCAMSMMQLGLSPALTRQFDTDTTTISQQVAWLLGLSAIAALIAQFVVLRPQRLTPVALP